MKFLVVFAAIAAVAFGYPASTTWTLDELSHALQSPGLDPILKPYLEAALNEMMAALAAGEELTHITVAMPYVGTYNAHELAEVLQNPNTNPAHIPYYEEALNELMFNLHNGIGSDWITVVIPADLPVEPVKPIEALPVEVPAAPVSSPLVQIIVNVQRQDQIADVSPIEVSPVEAPEDAPTPVQVVEEAFESDHDQIFNPIDELHPVMPVLPVRPILPIAIPRPPAPLPAPLPGFGPMI